MKTLNGERSTTLGQALREACTRLSAAQVDSPQLVAEALLAHTLDVDRARLLARPELPLSHPQLASYQSLVDRCESGEPLAYVLGYREFYGLDFAVDARVLIPRPETELLIDTVLELARSAADPSHLWIADIGTGSGAIAVTLAVHLPHAHILATDISPEALDVARHNARRQAVSDRTEFRLGNLLAPIDRPVQLIVANLPYIRDDEWTFLSRTIRNHEPAIAFHGGPDGMALVCRLLNDAPRILAPGGSIVLEIGAAQGDAAVELARDVFTDADIQLKTDLAGRDRLLVVRSFFGSRR
jgi:release factor glutamine methyltransferase